LVAINVLNGLSLYALARFLTGARVIAICAGVLFQLSPYFTGHLSGHLNLMNGWLIPLGLLCFLKGIDTSHRGLALALGITIGAAAYTDYYVTVFLIASLIYWQVARVVAVTIRVGPYRAFDRGQQALVAMMAACSVGLGVIGLSGGFELEALGHTVSATSGINLRTAIWVLLIALAGRHFRPRIHAARRLRWGWTDLRFAAIALSVSLVIVAPLALASVRSIGSGDYIEPPIRWRSAPPGIDLSSLLLGSPFHPLTGHLSRKLYELGRIDPVEQTAWFGILPSIGLLWVWLNRRRLAPPFGRWAGFAGLFLVWSLGPYLRIWGTNTGLWLPASLFQFIPGLANARIPSRALLVVHLSSLLIIALAARQLKLRVCLIVAVTVLTAADYVAVPFPVTSLSRPSVYERLATLPGGGLLELPVGFRDGFGDRGSLGPEALFHQTIHRHPIVGGFVARLSPTTTQRYEANPALRVLLDASASDDIDIVTACELRGWQDLTVRYVSLDLRRAGLALSAYVSRCLPVRLILRTPEWAIYATLD
jgi:hypothetical protein